MFSEKIFWSELNTLCECSATYMRRVSGCRLEKQEGLCWIGCGGQYENKRRAIRGGRTPFRTLSNAGSSLTSVIRHMGPRLDGFLEPHVGLNKPFKQRRSC